MMHPAIMVTVYTKSDCPWCLRAKEFLNQRAVPFEEVVINELAERQKVYDELGLVGMERTMPQVMLHDDLGETYRIGGWDKLMISGIESLKVLGLKQEDAIDTEGAMEIMIRRTAQETTPGFMLLPGDEFALATVDFWIAQARTKLEADHPKINSALRRRAEIVAWQEIYGSKTPD